MLLVFVQAMQDPNSYVRDTTAWTVGRVFEFQHDTGNEDVPPLITPETLPQVVQVLLVSLQDQVHIATRACNAIGRLAEGFMGSAGWCWELLSQLSWCSSGDVLLVCVTRCFFARTAACSCCLAMSSLPSSSV